MYFVRFLGKPGENKKRPEMGNIYFPEEEKEKAVEAAQMVVKNGVYPFAQVFHNFEFVSLFEESKRGI